jgi:hypothetical protein
MDLARIAIDNISKFGDTDIFPFPIENMMFYDRASSAQSLLLDIEKDFDNWASKYPVNAIHSCIPVGYTGYRWATIIDPLWNAFLLYQVLKISDLIEKARVAVSKETVFSYRLKIEEASGKLFDQEINWRQFYDKAVKTAEVGSFQYVVRFDISDFYNRVYHHKLENEIIRIGADANIKSRIMKILQDISGYASYGLPVGGNAARILAELLLNPMDQMMISRRYNYLRFVDDFILFANNREDAFSKLNWCADYLLRNQGLSLQKSKTQILTKSEFIAHAKSTLEGDDDPDNKDRSQFMKIHIHYDPYSLTAEEDYQQLRNQLAAFNITALIKDEIRKSRIHLALGKQLMNAILYLNGTELNLAVNVICSNLDAFYPVLPTVMQTLYKKILELDPDTRLHVIEVLTKLIDENSYLLQTENNAAYVIRILSLVNCEPSIQAINYLYTNMSSSVLVRNNCIYAMTNLENHYWLADLKSKYSTLSLWEKRAFIAASYFLQDEGKYWREHTKNQFSALESEVRDWVASKNVVTTKWKLPL